MISQKALELLLDDERVTSFGVLKASGLISVNTTFTAQATFNNEVDMMAFLIGDVENVDQADEAEPDSETESYED